MFERKDFTYEAGTDEAIHPDTTICWRFIEVAMSDCEFGCKIYADPRSNVRVLKHYAGYGCDSTKLAIDTEMEFHRADAVVDQMV
jgi:hypothetical protein